jgi:hypothetical protein
MHVERIGIKQDVAAPVSFVTAVTTSQPQITCAQIRNIPSKRNLFITDPFD